MLELDGSISTKLIAVLRAIFCAYPVWLVIKGLGHIRAKIDTSQHVFQLKRQDSGVRARMDELYRELIRIDLHVFLNTTIWASDFDSVHSHPAQIRRSYSEGRGSCCREDRIDLLLRYCLTVVALHVNDFIAESTTIVTPLCIHFREFKAIVFTLQAVELKVSVGFELRSGERQVPAHVF